MGTPEFSEVFLQAVIQAKYNLVAVYTRPDKPQGREQELVASPVKILALGNHIPVEQPIKFDEAAIEKLKSYKPDLIIVAAYGRILPQAVLDLPGFGCVNVHPSLLPKYRGPSPIQNALLNGETVTGITIMLMDAGMDTGHILSQKTVGIDAGETALQLEKKLALEGIELLLETLPRWIKRELEPVPQKNEDATLCELIEREDGRIFWNENAETIYNKYRAFDPWPGVFAYWKKSGSSQPLRIKFPTISIIKSDPETKHIFGEVFEIGEKIGIQTGAGVLCPETIQLEGKEPVSSSEFLRGYPNFIGSILE